MKNLKVSMKLIISFMIVLLMAVAVGVVGIIGMSSLQSSQQSMFYENMMAIEAIGDLRAIFANDRNTMRTLILHNYDPVQVQNNKALLEQNGVMATQVFADYDATITDMSLEADYLLAKELWTGDYRDVKSKVLELVDQGRFDEAYEMYRTEAGPIVEPLNDGLEASKEVNVQWGRESYQAGQELHTMLTIILISALGLAAAVSLFFTFYISSLISKPLKVLASFMNRAGTTGDITMTAAESAEIAAAAKVKDEIGQTINSTSVFIDHITVIAQNLETVATGDLTPEVSLLSDKDTMGKSMQEMINSLNEMFANINTSTQQVSTGAKQVADGAQSLAQGSTEQAASIQELSASIGDIASSTKNNAEIAAKTAKLSGTIRDNAEKGSRQMDEMITAVKDINDASLSISKIIKTIDDIAFQTNILALNAAVEAARAGQHGKGFAVVAEEVRNLASKSAEAAKDTGDMIQNSMDKAELGSQIAGETAASLKEIVSGISESSEMIQEIAEASETQSLGISQINTGIDQVAQVVQQNSATAQQSAAASEEMSSQSTMLEELISHFKLKDQGGGFRSLPSSPSKVAAPVDDGFAMSDNNGFGKY